MFALFKKKKNWKLNVESYRKACITCILQYFNFGFVFFFVKLDGNSNSKYISIEDFLSTFRIIFNVGAYIHWYIILYFRLEFFPKVATLKYVLSVIGKNYKSCSILNVYQSLCQVTNAIKGVSNSLSLIQLYLGQVFKETV